MNFLNASTLRLLRQQLDHCLIAYAFKKHPSSFITPFFHPSTLKQRILMLQKSETNRWALAKYGAVATLSLVLFFFVAACEDQSKKDKDIVSQGKSTISGRITANDGGPLPGATIQLKGATIGTTTDADGNYKLVNVPSNGTLQVEFSGFKRMEIPVNGHTAISAQLELSTGGKMPDRSKEISRQTVITVPPVVDDHKGQVFTVVEKNPEFPGGLAGLGKYITDNLRYPAAATRAGVSGRVFVNFVVNVDGTIQHVQILKGLGFGTDEEAVRVVQSMPRWKPSMQGGKPVRVQFNLPMNFQLEKQVVDKSIPTVVAPPPPPPVELPQSIHTYRLNGKQVNRAAFIQAMNTKPELKVTVNDKNGIAEAKN